MRRPAARARARGHRSGAGSVAARESPSRKGKTGCRQATFDDPASVRSPDRQTPPGDAQRSLTWEKNQKKAAPREARRRQPSTSELELHAHARRPAVDLTLHGAVATADVGAHRGVVEVGALQEHRPARGDLVAE